MKYVIIAVLIFASSALYSQQRQQPPRIAQTFDEIAFLDTLGKKNTATIGDALILFRLTLEKKQPGFIDDPDKDAPLKKGYIAYMAANNLSLNDGLLFRIFNNNRYAFRVCVAQKLMNEDGSENDIMSGEELIEFLRLASEYKEKGAAK